MASKDEFTMYGSMEHATLEFQRIARQALWEAVSYTHLTLPTICSV